MDKPKIISHKNIFRAELFDVKELKLKFPDGKDKIHRIAERSSTVSVFPLTQSNNVYLVRQYRYLLDKTTLEAMAGFIKKGESSLSAAKRELREETGIYAEQWEEIARIEMTASVFKSTAYLFLAKDLAVGKPNPDEGEEIEVVRMPLSDAVKKVMSGEINVSASMVGIMLLDKLRREKKL